MATPLDQFNTNSETYLQITKVKYHLKRAMRKATDQEEHYRKLLQLSNARSSRAEAEVRRLKEECIGLKESAELWEDMFNKLVDGRKQAEEYIDRQQQDRAKVEKALEKKVKLLEEKVKLLQQQVYAKHVNPATLPMSNERIRVQSLQDENAALVNKQEKLEEDLSLLKSITIETLHQVTASVRALVTQVEKSQPGKMFAAPQNMTIGRKRKRAARVPKRNCIEHSKLACFANIQSAEAALVDATMVWTVAQREAEAMLTVGRKTIVDLVFGRGEARE